MSVTLAAPQPVAPTAMSTSRVTMVVVGLRFGLYVIEEQLLEGPGKPFVNLRGVCELNRALAREIAEEHGLRRYGSLDDVLADEAVEAVGLFTPPAGRAELVRRCIRAGKHVMTTKPFEIDSRSALDVLREAEQLERVVYMNSPTPLPAPEIARFLTWQRDVPLGRPVSARWETYVRRIEEADGSWYDDPERCPAAPIFRIGIYGINELIRLCGPVAAVSVASCRLATERPTPDTAELTLRFVGGGLGSILASYCIDDGVRYGNSLTVHYEHGTVTSTPCKPGRHGMTAATVRLQAIPPGGRGTVITDSASFNEPALHGRYHWPSFCAAVRSDKAKLHGEIDPETIAHGVAVIQAMRRAEMSERWEAV